MGQLRRLAHGGIPSWRERIALSFGLSLAIIPLLGLVITPITGSLSTDSALLGMNVFVLLGAATALLRRNLIPADERLQVPFRQTIDSIGAVFDGNGNRLLSVIFVVSAVVAVTTLGFVFLTPSDGEAYTSATLLSENENGELAASGYPTTLSQGSSEELTLRVENNEDAETTYTAVAVLQSVETSEDSLSVTESEVVFRQQETVPDGEAWTETHTVTPSVTGEDLRLRYYIYRGEPPQDVSEDTAYRTLSLWMSSESAE